MTGTAGHAGICVQMAYMDLSLFLAAECASDKDNNIFTERLRHDCQAALMRLHCSPKVIQQRCDFINSYNDLAENSARNECNRYWNFSAANIQLRLHSCPAGIVW